MSILTFFVIIPVLMLLGLWLASNLNQVRGVMVVGSTLLLALSVYLTIDFIQLRHTMPAESYPMLYTASHMWFAPLHIAYSVGVDGISVAMLLLSSIIVFTGTFAAPPDGRAPRFRMPPPRKAVRGRQRQRQALQLVHRLRRPQPA